MSVLIADIFGVHATLLSTGKILYFTGNEYSWPQQQNYDYAHARLCDCATDSIFPVPAASDQHDLFCCGHTLGGRRYGGYEPGHEDMHNQNIHIKAMHGLGIRDTSGFTGRRWYPALLGLESGHVLMFGGHPGRYDARHHNNTIEIFNGSAWVKDEAGVTAGRMSAAIPLNVGRYRHEIEVYTPPYCNAKSSGDQQRSG